MSREVKLQWCPVCFSKLNATSEVIERGYQITVEAVAEVGDYTVCLYCGSILRLRDDKTLEEIKLIDVHESVRMKTAQVQAAIRTMGRREPLNVWKM
jgi:hypothetical protein